jgi:hypothetical protein
MSLETIKKRFTAGNSDIKIARMKHTITQAAQDIFAMVIAEKTGNKTYLEIGAKQPYYISNTNFLEKSGWTGVSIEINEAHKPEWQSSDRDESRVHWGDALTYNYSALTPKRMGFLSCDIDPPWHVNIEALRKVMSSGLEFDCICYEHNKYLTKGAKKKKLLVPDTIEERKAQMEAVLFPLGYKRVVTNATVYGIDKKPFEDWFVHKDVDFPEMKYNDFLVEYEELFWKYYTI